MMRKLSGLLLCLLLFLPIKVQAAENVRTDNDIEVKAIERAEPEDMGTVNVRFAVSYIYQYKSSIQVAFTEVNTGEVYTIDVDDFKADVCKVDMPVGEWAYDYVNFEHEPVYGATATLSGMDSFTVSKNAETNISLVVEERQTSTRLMYVDLVVETDVNFDGTVQMYLEGESDAYYTDDENTGASNHILGTKIQEKYSLRFDSGLGYTTKMDAGVYTITEVYAYDKDGNPMDIVYNKEVRVGRYDDNPEIVVEIYGAGTGATKGSLDQITEAIDTPKFAYNYYIRDVKTYSDYFGLNDEKENENMEVNLTEEEVKEEQAAEEAYQEWVESGAEDELETETAEVNAVTKDEKKAHHFGLLSLFAGILAVAGGLFAYFRHQEK